MAHPASRVLAMLELLQAHHRLSGADLAARLGVDERTVRRYATTLIELGIPVTADRGRYGGYRLSPGFKLPPLMLTDDEAVAVVLGLVAADRLGLGAEAPATAAAQAKISRILPAPLAGRLGALQDSLGFTLAPRPAQARPATDTLLALGAATRAHRQVEMTYRSRSGAAAGAGTARPASRRTVDPYGLVFHAGHWYLVAYDHRREEVRSFRVDRMIALDVTEETFEAPTGFDAVSHVTRQWAGLPWQWEVEVLIEADVAQVRRRVPASMADIAETADGVLLRTRAQSLPGMAQMLAGLGWPFTVLSPPELRTALAEHAADLQAWAARTRPPRTGEAKAPEPRARAVGSAPQLPRPGEGPVPRTGEGR
jgi:predicted DNA-binding transcriptional regulator YafY